MKTLHDPVDDLAAALAGTNAPVEREQAFLKYAEGFGVNRFAYLTISQPVSPWYFETNYPREWVQHYLAQGYAAVDVVPLESRRSALPFHWRTALSRPEYGNKAKQVFDESAAFGIHDGYSVPIHSAHGLALMSMAVDDPALFTPSARKQLYALQLMALHFHMSCERSLTEAPAPPVHLTAREREVLTWAAQGKTGWEIGQILHLAERTVTYHVENAKVKLGATSRGHAIVKAITLGLIAP
ncbi:MAG: LuxR family transcriptional regulator [Rhodospirillaceae bacterium]|nr:LuxR family transcriptional regulator [Rhodospirillales bacterium]